MIQRARTSRKGSEFDQLLSVSACGLAAECVKSQTDKPPELELDEEGTRISLTIVDTPGFGDQIDNEARSAILALK